MNNKFNEINQRITIMLGWSDDKFNDRLTHERLAIIHDIGKMIEDDVKYVFESEPNIPKTRSLIKNTILDMCMDNPYIIDATFEWQDTWTADLVIVTNVPLYDMIDNYARAMNMNLNA